MRFRVMDIANILLQFIITGKLGITDFVNPKDLTKPVHEVQSNFILQKIINDTN